MEIADNNVLSSPNIRWLIAVLAIIAEFLSLTYFFEAPRAALHPQWSGLLALFNNGLHYKIAIIYGAAILLVTSGRFDAVAQALLPNQSSYRWQPWAVLHVVAMFAFVWLTALGFGTGTHSPNPSFGWLIAWLMAGATNAVAWLRIVAPTQAWVDLLRTQGPYLALALAAGTVAWFGGVLAQQLWEPLAEGTLRLSAQLLSLIYSDITYLPAQRILGSTSFTVEIAAPCSGYEGIAVVTAFVAIYLWLFRHDLRFPRALVLFPLGIACVWLANVLRIAALVVIGDRISPEVAGRGFHSNAGWITFLLVTFALLAVSHRWLSVGGLNFARAPAASQANRSPEVPLLVPFIALAATAIVVAAVSDGVAVLYPLTVVVTAATLWSFRRAYRAAFGPLNWYPFAIGIFVFLIWLLLVPGSSSEGQRLAQRLSEWPLWLAYVWIGFRLVGSVVTVPFAEELAFRGYLIRKLASGNIEESRPGVFTWPSFIISSVLFGLLHESFLAGAIAGGAFAVALYRRGKVGDAILAHMTTNLLIGLTVIVAGHWGLWA
ncbi:MAG: exosortase E/protease, VPEID-CTERM system [Caldilineaceae bacterium]